ncbi:MULTISPECIES: hypothetical protein [unclassified Sphingomonas]|uniref:DUF6975 family protein n=1 Tax=unclassified Sphingomonas TaxID=196159 RepID=UPI002269A4D1|nr:MULTISPECIES: hypothetical protein [unclassified Sphingomonas]
MLNTVQTRQHHSAWDLVTRLGATDGSAGHPHLAQLMAASAAHRDLADAVHALCDVHAQHPGMPADAHLCCAQPDACDWLDEVAAAFAGERAYLARLAAAAGPTPSTPGQAESEAAMTASRHALEMLARSERRGCATGAVAALVLDWTPIRHLLDRAAQRFGVEPPRCTLPRQATTAASIEPLGATPATERAITFGAQQLFAQHRGLWDLLEARAHARNG